MSVLDIISYLRDRETPRTARVIATAFEKPVQQVCFTLRIMHKEKLVSRNRVRGTFVYTLNSDVKESVDFSSCPVS